MPLVVDLDGHGVIATIRLPGRPRWAAYDAATDEVFVNIREPAQILALSADSLTVRRSIAVPADGLHGIRIDGDWLFCAADTQTLETEPGAHTLGIDPNRHAVHSFFPASSGAAFYFDQ